VRDLQETLIRTLADYGIEAERREGQALVGVWVGEEKIASLGIHLKRWITTHGFALNVSTDLGYFAGIVACGLPEVRLTSIARLTGETPPLAAVAACYARHFAEVFERDLEAIAAVPA
jgi:lipoyl(octanoyl) transferase